MNQIIGLAFASLLFLVAGCTAQPVPAETLPGPSAVPVAPTAAPVAPKAAPVPSSISVKDAGQAYLRIVEPVNQAVRALKQVTPLTAQNLARKKALAGQLADAERVMVTELQRQQWPVEVAGDIKDLIREITDGLPLLRVMAKANTVSEYNQADQARAIGVAAQRVRVGLNLADIAA